MIRYDIDFEILEEKVDDLQPTWRTRAARASSRIWATKPRQFDDSGPSWSEIKRLYIELQAHKCCYCERKLEAEDYGRVEHDVEHYRPKREVEPWARRSYPRTIAHGNRKGYCMLAYELRNYCVACKTCNTALKRNYFPIAGRAGRTDARDLVKLNQRERPMIPYPLGRLDEDPEELIAFVGFLPLPRRKRGQRWWRGRVTIDLFALDERTELTQGRCMVLRALWLVIRAAFSDELDEDERALAREQYDNMLAGHEPHTACARAFARLFQADPRAAYVVYRQACEHLNTTS